MRRRQNIEEQLRLNILMNGTLDDVLAMEEADELKQAALDQLEAQAPVSAEEAWAVLFRHCGSYERMRSAMDLLVKGVVVGEQALQLIAAIYTDDNDLFAFQAEIRKIIKRSHGSLRGPVPELMRDDERVAWQELPDRVQLWRGCSAVNIYGMSWTLDRNIAVAFPTLQRFRPPEGCQPLLASLVVPKSRILAIKLERQESEAVVALMPRDHRMVSVEPI